MTNLLALADEVILAGEKATGDPWVFDDHEVKPGDLGPETYGIFQFYEDDPAHAIVTPHGRKADAEFIVLARTAAPALAQAYKEAVGLLKVLAEKSREAIDLIDAKRKVGDFSHWESMTMGDWGGEISAAEVFIASTENE